MSTSKLADHLTLATANTATGSTAVFGGMAYLNENAAAIGAICAMISLVVAIVFYVLNYRIRKQEAMTSREALVEEILGQIASQAPEVKSALSRVKDRREFRRADSPNH